MFEKHKKKTECTQKQFFIAVDFATAKQRIE